MITAQEVINWMGVSLPAEDAHLALVIPATNSYVNSLPSIDRNADGTWKATTKLGALMYASRLYQRKNSPGGIEAVGEVTTYVSRYDADISRLLNIDSFKKPLVG